MVGDESAEDEETGSESEDQGEEGIQPPRPEAGKAEDAKNPELAAKTGAKPAPPQPGAKPGAEAAAGQAAPRAALGGLAISAPVGRGGKNKPEDVSAVQEALNRRAKAGLTVDGKMGPATIKAIEEFQKSLNQFKPDGIIQPGRGTARALAGNGKLPAPVAPPKPVAPPQLPKPTLVKAPLVWDGTRDILDKNINELKKGILAQYGAEHSDLVDEIDANLAKLDVIVDKLDRRLSDSLTKANNAKDDAARKAELKNAKAILTDYIKFVKNEPLIAHVDKNPFGVDTQLKKIIMDSLTHMAQVVG
jgi:peptidoglycan hydrolase-like protein with peptidoglycan-binding domain